MRRFQLLEAGTERRPARDSGWSGAVACLNRFRGFSEPILNWEKIYCNALMNQYFYATLVIVYDSIHTCINLPVLSWSDDGLSKWRWIFQSKSTLSMCFLYASFFLYKKTS